MGSPLPELVVDGFDSDQIWEELQLQNIPLLKAYFGKHVGSMAKEFDRNGKSFNLLPDEEAQERKKKKRKKKKKSKSEQQEKQEEQNDEAEVIPLLSSMPLFFFLLCVVPFPNLPLCSP